jgi:hypothetical protein
MNYELCKKLKDAGFPQKGDNQDGYANDGGYEPYLHELIEACQVKNHQICLQECLKRWRVSISSEKNFKYTSSYGETVEEAVANLWFALNTTKSAN